MQGPDSAFASSSYVPSDISWNPPDEDLFATLQLNGPEDSGLNPIMETDFEEIDAMIAGDTNLQSHTSRLWVTENMGFDSRS
jgi:hypothetical protein